LNQFVKENQNGNITSKKTKPGLRNRYVNETYSIAQKKQLCFYCRIMLLALHVALICSSLQRQALIRRISNTNGHKFFRLIHMHVTIDTIRQTQDAAKML